jgi:hypothetical protein
MKTSLLCCVIASLLCACGGAPTVVNPSPPAPPPVVVTPSAPPPPPPPVPPVIIVPPQPVNEATLTWTAPTTNTDGSPLVNLAGYRVHYWNDTDHAVDTVTDIPNAMATMFTVTPLPSGRWHFDMTAYNTAGVESVFSEEVTKVVP